MPCSLRACVLISSSKSVRQQTWIQTLTRGSSAASHHALVEPMDHPKCAQPSRVNLGPAGQVVQRAKLIEHHHPEQYLPPPEHQLEGILFARLTIGFLLALAETPAIDGQRDQAFLGTYRSVGRLHFNTFQKLFFAEAIHSGVPVDV